MSTLKKKTRLNNLSTLDSKLLFNYAEVKTKKKAYTDLEKSIKEDAVKLVAKHGGQIFTLCKGHNVHAKTMFKEYLTVDLAKLKEEQPKIYKQYKVKKVESTTLEVNVNKI